ncbi:HAD family hydrolase [Dactylosporangium sp. CA-139066]|uniref:HAD family hydrolase n=1 Tax=Dactylosporangium sp. CA-139066 TaxID=3239930 RepID=UPI003D8B13B4
MPRPVVFDLYNTLVDGADDERDRVVADMAVLVGVAPAELVSLYHSTWRERLVRWNVEETLRILAGRLGAVPPEAAVARAAQLRRGLARRLLDTVSGETLSVLDALRAAGHRLALISNATSETAEAWPSSRLAARFDAAVFSCETGLAKPDPAIYHVAAARLGVPATECVFVGDGSDDELTGAAAAGMSVLRTTQFRDSAPQWTGPVVAALSDLDA